MSSTRLIIITTPPPEISAAIQDLREPLCSRYHADWALRYPPHVTLRTGVIVPDQRLEEVFAAFANLCAGATPFSIRTGPVAHSTSKYEGEEHFFLFLPVIKDASLAGLNQLLLCYREFRKSDRIEFHPHITLFWGDLPPDAKEELKYKTIHSAPSFAPSFEWLCTTVSFYVQRGDLWQPLRRIPLGGATHR